MSKRSQTHANRVTGRRPNIMMLALMRKIHIASRSRCRRLKSSEYLRSRTPLMSNASIRPMNPTMTSVCLSWIGNSPVRRRATPCAASNASHGTEKT